MTRILLEVKLMWVGPLFELLLCASLFELKQINMHQLKVIVKISFVNIKACQLAFEELKKCPMLASILVRPNFTKMFILDVD